MKSVWSPLGKLLATDPWHAASVHPERIENRSGGALVHDFNRMGALR